MIRSNFFSPRKQFENVFDNILFIQKNSMVPKFWISKPLKYATYQFSGLMLYIKMMLQKWILWSTCQILQYSFEFNHIIEFRKSSENRRAFWRHFEADNEILWLNWLKIQIPEEFFLQHSPVEASQKANISRVFMIFRRKMDFRTLNTGKRHRA